ncbi:hypothetical protein G195_011629, partial [Phytophthora kernoviae 00238/432]
MTSRSLVANFQFNHLGQKNATMSDSVIGAVIPRRQARDLSTSTDVMSSISLEARVSESGTCYAKESLLSPRAASAVSAESGRSPDEEKERIKAARLIKRRAQLRACQARFRQKQRDLKLQAQKCKEQELQQLRDGIQCLKLEHQSLKLRGKAKPSPFNIASEVLHFLDTSLQSPWRIANAEVMESHMDTRRSVTFLKTVLAPDVAMGELHGFDSLMEQLRRYSQYFDEPQIQLERIETLALGVLSATATLSLTITETTLRYVFQQSEKSSGGMSEDEDKSLWTRLVGERLGCRCSINFLFDEKSGRVERLEPSIDFMSPLLRALRGVEDVMGVFENALLTSEGVL